jgi:hypothetical protein
LAHQPYAIVKGSRGRQLCGGRSSRHLRQEPQHADQGMEGGAGSSWDGETRRSCHCSVQFCYCAARGAQFSRHTQQSEVCAAAPCGLQPGQPGHPLRTPAPTQPVLHPVATTPPIHTC